MKARDPKTEPDPKFPPHDPDPQREIDSGRRITEVARHLEVSPKLLERWRGEWQARGELAFPGIGRRGLSPALTELQRIAELERKIGHLLPCLHITPWPLVEESVLFPQGASRVGEVLV